MTIASGAARPAPHWRRRRKNDLWFALATVALFLVRWLPRSVLRWLGSRVGALAHALLAAARNRTRSNLARVYPALSELERRAIAKKVFLTLGRNLGDTAALLRPSEPAGATLVLTESSVRVLEEAMSEGRGVVYVTLHLGPWERMAALLSERGFPITMVARESYDPRFHPLVYDRLRDARGIQTIYRGRRGAPFAIARALSAGRVVGFAVDLASHVPSCPVRLLGVESRLAIGPLHIAMRFACPIVIGTPAPTAEGRGLWIRVERLRTEDLDSMLDPQAALAQRTADALGERIQALRLHWPWMHDSFRPNREERIAPAGSTSLH